MKTCEYIEPDGTACSCNKEVVPGRNYCEDHLWLVYQKGTRLGQRKKDARRAATVIDIVSEINAAVQELIEEGYDI